MVIFTPNGKVTFETCPVCGEPNVKVEHGWGETSCFTEGPMHSWHCPECGDEIVAVLECELCDRGKESGDISR